MLACSDSEKDTTDFLRIFRRVFLMVTALVCFSLVTSIYAILGNNPIYFHDWRGGICIVLTIIFFLLYIIPAILTLKSVWPLPFPLAVSIWSGMYLAVVALSLIDRSFLWDFYIVFSATFALFARWRTALAVSVL
ncbi:MAG: hypothetical protein ACRDHW_12770, partial [Ktedonobacteraceae bacterium]